MAVALVAFTGNLVAFLVISKTKYFRNLSTCFLGSLIMTDFLVGILVAPMHVAQMASESLRKNCAVVDATVYLLTLLVGVSVFSIILISYDRYLHMTKTQNYPQFMSKRKAVILITVAWALPSIVVMLRIFGRKKDKEYGYGIMAAIIFGCLNLVILVACYASIMKIVKKKEKEMADSQAQEQIQQHRINNEIRVAKVITAIIICFVMTVIPILTFLCVFAVNTFLKNGIPSLNDASAAVYYYTVATVSMANSGINPLIYYFRNPKFKESMVGILERFCPVRRRSNRVSSECGRRNRVISFSTGAS